MEVDGKEWKVLLACPDPLELLQKSKCIQGPWTSWKLILESAEAGGGYIKRPDPGKTVEETIPCP